MTSTSEIVVRNTRSADTPLIIELSRKIYPEGRPWSRRQLASHLKVFPEGQFVAVESQSNEVVGMCASLIVSWEEYKVTNNWWDMTDSGTFTNHDPEGRTLYGAEVMVDPSKQRGGIGSKLYEARKDLVRRLGLRRIRAGARLRGYHRYADEMDVEEYVIKVCHGELKDPTLSFQLKHGFDVIAVASEYLGRDPESLGYAAVIEWINKEVVRPEDYAGRDPRFLKKD